MINKGYFDPNGIALGNDEVKANFIAGKTAFYQNGSWNCGEVNDQVANAQVALFPVMDASKATYGQVIGGPSDSLAVSATSKNPEVAAAAAFELGKGICHYCYLAGAGLPAWTPDYDTSAVKPLVAAVADIVAEGRRHGPLRRHRHERRSRQHLPRLRQPGLRLRDRRQGLR